MSLCITLIKEKKIEEEFLTHLTNLRNEINKCIQTYYTYITIYRVAYENPGVLKILNRNSIFWNNTLYSLQCTFFIVLGRIFDDDEASFSVHQLLNYCTNNSSIFSLSSLARRNNENYAKKKYSPTIDDFRELKKIKKSYKRKYDEYYKDIRDKVFAHNELMNSYRKSAP